VDRRDSHDPSAGATPVTLDNCDREPIHVPGSIQAHGALLAFDRAGRLRWRSATAAQVLGLPVPELGRTLAGEHLGGNAALATALAAEMVADPDPALTPRQHELRLADGRRFELLLHHSGDLVVAEFEPRAPDDDPAAFAIRAHRAIDALRRGRTVQDLLEIAVREVRALTGFDRVMAYRFRHDASGDVVAEAREAALEPYLHRRYPAGDIPAQARRLYTVNTLRLIADVASAPVGLLGDADGPLDLSHGVLRSVSPVHIEYLTNMGVRASMSVSILLGGQLWGMLACHHMAPRHVPYAVRMTCDVIAQVLASGIQGLLAREQERRMAQAASLRSRMVERSLTGDDALAALLPCARELAATLEAGAVVLAERGRIAVEGPVAEAGARALLDWLQGPEAPLDAGLYACHAQAALPPEVAAALQDWCGVLALRHDAVDDGWIVALRREQIETVSWGGRPEKEYAVGPLGPRLTPRGSFAVWRETVRGTAVPWSATELDIARQLLDELGRASGARQAELGRARNQLLAVLGHDLRNPLQAISMSSHLLERGADTAQVGQRIQSATSRMQRLIAQVLDMSRLQSGLGLGFALRPVDLVGLVNAQVDEVQAAFPATVVERRLPAALRAEADPDRLAQLLGNLLSNARHHGLPGRPVAVALRAEGGDAVLQVRNQAPPIAEEQAGQLFSAYKRESLGQARNPGGLGLGLYIAAEIARGHGGDLSYAHDGRDVVFTARWPVQGPAPG
jgi:light-regulated signal transduction histidine kinase (bacteriophytochrome)